MRKLHLILVLFLLIGFAPELRAQDVTVTCEDIVTDIDMWGMPARGVDLRAFTDSTLHWIGCPSDGCEPNEFFCNFDPANEVLSFGSTNGSALRASLDIDNVHGDQMPTAEDYTDDCCTEEESFGGVCNAPDEDNNGVPIDAAQALCDALGYENGTLTSVNNNSCPEVNTTTEDGSNWTSDFVEEDGYGNTYTCTGFKLEPGIRNVPTLSEWGLIAMAGILGIIGFIVIRRRKVTA